MSNLNSTKQKYQEGDLIVYPVQGVGKITEVKNREFKGNQTLYYVAYFSDSDMTVMIPVEKTEELGVRPIISREQALKAFETLKNPDASSTSDWKIRYQTNTDLVKTGDINDIASVVSTLYTRSKQKDLPILERKQYDNALKLLVHEISLSLGQSREETENSIFSILEEQ
ncbi:MAG: CarD family transcriptional regulator [Spirochaetales bacterium]|nr:CarD family transcriptional regulator [Spirochaetales bacterium]